jgi:hypothetical protein
MKKEDKELGSGMQVFHTNDLLGLEPSGFGNFFL